MSELMDECIHGLGPVSACTICNGRDKRESQERQEAWRTFSAKFAPPTTRAASRE